MIRVVLPGACIALALLCLPAYGQQALVRSLAQQLTEIGQAYLTHTADRCLAVLPTHVLAEAGEVAALLSEGQPPLLGESGRAADLGDDVSVAVVRGALTDDCGYSTLAVSRGVASRVSANAIASLRSLNPDGTIAQTSVTIVDDDGVAYLRIQPTNDFNQLRKGQSGSLLMAGDTPIGMLLSVDARFGIGKVIRFDALFDKVDGFVAGGRAVSDASPAPGSAGGASPPAGTAAGEIVAWSAMPLDAAHRASNLLAAEATVPPWVAVIDALPVIVELDLGERVAVDGVDLYSLGVDDPAKLPAKVELLVSGVAEGRRWRSVYGGPIRFDEGVAEIRFAPGWVRQVKLVVSGVGAGARTVALGRLRVLRAD